MAECPLEGCNYEGPTRSVEAHISGMDDPVHVGRFGPNHRGRIEATIDEDDVAVPGEDESPDLDVGVVETESEGVGPGLTLAAGTLLLGVAVVVESRDSPSSEGGSDPSAGETQAEASSEEDMWGWRRWRSR